MCAFFACPTNLNDKCLHIVHTSKDRILLEGEEAGADDDGDEEVFALKGIPSSESDEDQEDEDAHEGDGDNDEDEDDQPPSARASKGRKSKSKPPMESDDEEEEESEEEESWGRKKSAYYSSNAAELDSEDEEANEQEEQEARRIQAKARDAMRDEDFGLADMNLDDMEVTEECVCPFLVESVVTEMLAVHSSNLS